MDDNLKTDTSKMPDGRRNTDMPQNNFDRLALHLDRGSLAKRLVDAYRTPGDKTPTEAMSEVVSERNKELKSRYEKTKNQ